MTLTDMERYNTAALLRDIADEVEQDPSRWTQHVLARSAKGNPCRRSQSRLAHSWCLTGHIDRRLEYDVAGQRMWDNARDALRLSITDRLRDIPIWHGVEIENMSVVMINDTEGVTAADIVQWCRHAADCLEEAPKG